jgi:hypothetical protein
MIATTTTRPVPDTPGRRWWTSRRRHYDRPAEVLAVLQHARAIVEAGWVQNRWTAAPVEGTAGGPGGDGSVRACVVAAVALAVRARDPRADLAVDTGPAVAFVWDAVFSDRSGHDASTPRSVRGGRPAPDQAAGRSAPPHVRVARMRELARWNDERGRTRADVVAVLDRAAARVVARVVEPAGV